MKYTRNSAETTINLSFISVNYIITKKKQRINVMLNEDREVNKEKAIKGADILSSIEEKLKNVFNN